MCSIVLKKLLLYPLRRIPLRLGIFAAGIIFFLYACPVYAQDGDIECTIDAAQSAGPLAKIYRPGIDLSGRGLHNEITWPQTVAAQEALDTWQTAIGFGGMYRLQYNLWEISQLNKAPGLRNKLLANYEKVIKSISDAGGIVILDIFGTPAGLGQVLDKKSPAENVRAFKALIKGVIRELSCNKRYTIWYEFWNAPDLEEFYLGRKQEYFTLYRAVAEAVKELRAETKIFIPLGGPGISWWFQSMDGNTIATPERSFIYEIIKYCYRHRLPLDFITWHGYSTDPCVEKETTIYGKTAVTLIREWLTYFGFDRNTPLIVDEWNYDSNANVLPERKEKSFICASYIPSRIRSMYEAGIDHQLYFCLEDFQNNREGVVRNTGVFSFDPDSRQYKGAPKAVFNVFRMFSMLAPAMVPVKLDDDFAGIIAAKNPDQLTVIVYNYIDPDIAASYLSRNFASLNPAERKILLNMIKSGEVEKLMLKSHDIGAARATRKIKALLKKAQELNDRAKKFEFAARSLKMKLKNLKGDYMYQRYIVDSSCSFDCDFIPAEEKRISPDQDYEERIQLNPYSVQMIVIRKVPHELPPQPPAETPAVSSGTDSSGDPGLAGRAQAQAQALKEASEAKEPREQRKE